MTAPAVYWLLAASVASQAALWVLRAVVLYDAYAARDDRGLAVSLLAIFLPLVIGSRFLAPRLGNAPARRVMLAVELGRVAVVSALAVCGPDARAVAAPVALCLLGLAQPVFASAQVAHLRMIVDESRLAGAMAALLNIERATHVAGLVAGSLILTALSVPQALGIAALSLMASVTMIALLPGIAQPVGSPLRGEARSRSARRRRLVVAVFLLNAGAGVINVFQVVASLRVFGGGPAELALMFLVVGCLGLVGAVAAAPTIARLGRERAALWASTGVLGALLGMSALPGLTWSAVAGGAMLGFGQVFAVAMHAEIVSIEARERAGRASARFQTATLAGISTNAALFLAFGSSLPLSAFILGSATLAALAILLIYRLPSSDASGVALAPDLGRMRS